MCHAEKVAHHPYHYHSPSTAGREATCEKICTDILMRYVLNKLSHQSHTSSTFLSVVVGMTLPWLRGKLSGNFSRILVGASGGVSWWPEMQKLVNFLNNHNENHSHWQKNKYHLSNDLCIIYSFLRTLNNVYTYSIIKWFILSSSRGQSQYNFHSKQSDTFKAPMPHL